MNRLFRIIATASFIILSLISSAQEEPFAISINPIDIDGMPGIHSLVALPMQDFDKVGRRIEIPIGKDFFDLVTIVCHPEMEDWKYENIRAVCNQYSIPNPSKSSIRLL